MKKTIIRSLLFLAFLAPAVMAAGPAGEDLLMNGGEQSKDFYFSDVRINIRVAGDGSFTADEFLTYDFQGSFSWGSRWIPLSVSRQGYSYDVRIEDFGITDESGNPLPLEVAESEDRLTARWHFQARDEKKTFHIRYRLAGGIMSYPDVSELYWQAVGSWDKPIANVVVTVTLPDPVRSKEELMVFGHGPLSGRAEIVDEKTARFSASNIPAGQYVEVRAVWPSGMVSGVPSNRHSRDSIRKEEAGFVEETIERARLAQERRQSTLKTLSRIFALWAVWFVLGPLIWFFFYKNSWKRVGKDYRFSDTPEYFRDLPSNLQPALTEVLLREGRPITPRSFTATLFDLARRGYLEMADHPAEKRGIFGPRSGEDTSVRLKKNIREEAGLLAYEKDLLEFLFREIPPSGESRFEISELVRFLKKEPRQFQKWYEGWSKKIRTEALGRGFIEPASLKTRNIFAAVTIPLTVLTLNPVLGILAGIFIPKLKRRSFAWARENGLWKALGRFLDDFSSFEDVPPEAYKLWEHYLVYGIIFGNAKKILKMLPVILRDERATLPAWYYGFGGLGLADSGRITSMIHSLESMATSIHQASTSAAHYSSGGGGGFSGGGGGGGGGGGASAG